MSTTAPDIYDQATTLIRTGDFKPFLRVTELRDAAKSIIGIKAFSRLWHAHLRAEERRNAEEAARLAQRELERQHGAAQRRTIYDAADNANFGVASIRIDQRRRRRAS